MVEFNTLAWYVRVCTISGQVFVLRRDTVRPGSRTLMAFHTADNSCFSIVTSLLSDRQFGRFNWIGHYIGIHFISARFRTVQVHWYLCFLNVLYWLFWWSTANTYAKPSWYFAIFSYIFHFVNNNKSSFIKMQYRRPGLALLK